MLTAALCYWERSLLQWSCADKDSHIMMQTLTCTHSSSFNRLVPVRLVLTLPRHSHPPALPPTLPCSEQSSGLADCCESTIAPSSIFSMPSKLEGPKKEKKPFTCGARLAAHANPDPA